MHTLEARETLRQVRDRMIVHRALALEAVRLVRAFGSPELIRRIEALAVVGEKNADDNIEAIASLLSENDPAEEPPQAA